MARLLLATPEGQQVVELKAHNSLGRHPSNTIQLLDKIVSKEHCIVELRGDTFVLRDLGSLNGTYVNGDRVIGERPLRHGDEIALGTTRGRFDDGTGQPVLPPTAGAFPAQPGMPPLAGPGLGAPPGFSGVPAQGAPQPFGAAGLSPNTPAASSSVGPAMPGGYPSSLSPSVRPAGANPTTAPLAAATGPRGTAGMPAVPPGGPPNNATRISVNDQARAIGTQIAATQKFLPHDQIASNSAQLAADYERLRLSYELSREIALERDLPTLLEKILLTIFKFVRADRGVIFLREPNGTLTASASLRRDGTDAPITVSSTIMNHVIKERATVLTHDAAMDFAASKGKSMILHRISSAIVAPLLHNDEILGVLWLDSETLAQFQPKDLEIVTAVAGQAAMFIEIKLLAKKIEQEIVNRERFSRLLSPNVAERVMSGELEVKKGGQLVGECTVFNSDIRGFTHMSDGAAPETIVEMLNEYFEQMVEVVFKFEGTLDKFMGDGIMALWGAPVCHPDDALRSVHCALEQLSVLGRFNRKRIEDGEPALAIGIGIHTGPLVAGYIGSSKALSYTVIGDTANTSARLCGVASPGQLLVSEATLAKLGNRFEVEELPPAQLKGKDKPFRVFNVIGSRPSLQVPATPGSAVSASSVGASGSHGPGSTTSPGAS
jgi:adenylate cyclase